MTSHATPLSTKRRRDIRTKFLSPLNTPLPEPRVKPTHRAKSTHRAHTWRDDDQRLTGLVELAVDVMFAEHIEAHVHRLQHVAFQAV
jgi:hypothetical protein